MVCQVYVDLLLTSIYLNPEQFIADIVIIYDCKFFVVSEFLSLQVPHALALIEPLDRLCVADRENMRVVCPRAGLYTVQGKKEPALTIQQPDMGRVFGVAAKGI